MQQGRLSVAPVRELDQLFLPDSRKKRVAIFCGLMASFLSSQAWNVWRPISSLSF